MTNAVLSGHKYQGLNQRQHHVAAIVACSK